MKNIQDIEAPQFTSTSSLFEKGGLLEPKDEWDKLSMAAKAEMMRVAVNHGIYDLQTIRQKYNEFAEGGDTDWSYNSWKRQIAEHMGIRPDEDNTYDYEAYFNKYPEEAWKMLKGDPTAHFSDEFKTVYHPTFSSKSIGNDGSIYSGIRNPKTNPHGLVGGTWSPDYHTFTMSPDGYRGPVSMDDRKWYLENAEDNGVQLREADGSLPIYDGIPWGGVLPNVVINGSRKGRRFEDGGFTSELDWSPDSWFSKRVAKPDGTLYNNEEAARLASHVPEYNSIEQTAKANGTWLKMPDGSVWKGDPRSWVMMQSEAYKKNYSPKPWYTGQAEWPTTFDYGKGKVDTNKVTRAPYYNNQMWFSDSKDYGQTFADYQNSTGLGWRFDTPGEEDIKGHNFLSAIPKEGNYRTLESSADGRPDQWQRLPFVLEDGTINRLSESQISVDSKGRNIRADKQKVLTDDVVNWSKDLGDQGIFMQNIDDGAIIKNGEILRQPINEFISQPGFTDKVKFIEGNTGDFDIDNPYKYANNFYVKDNSLDNNYAALGGPLVEAAMNEYKHGGKIYIKPSHRGRLTELKKRTGKTEAELYRTGGPAVRKMITFARSARKWKHGLGGNLFDGTSQPTQKMQIGLSVQDWPSYSLEQIVANGEKVQRQRQALGEAVARLGKNLSTESNDATAITNGKLQNQHLVEKAIKGAKANAAWEQEHPNLTTWGNTLATIPFVIASAPALDAIASTTIGQGVASGLNYISNTAKAIPYISKALPWAEAALATGSATHGVQEMKNGTFTPITALEVSPLAPPTIGIGNNLYLPHLREHLYASKAPIGYDGIIPAAKRMAEGILSGRRADIESPFWFNNESAKILGESYAFVPTKIPEAEKAQYIKEFGQRALKARADIWRMYNRLPQKYNTFVESNKYPGAYTASEDIKALKWVPFPDKNVDPGDFVNSVGGNVGLPQIINLGKGFPDAGYTSKEFGVTTLSDLWDLYPFSRPNDRLISRMQRGYQKAFNSTEAPKFNWLKPLDEKLAKFEVGKLVNAKPIMIKNDIPWTMDRKLVTDANGSLNFKTSYTQGFHSDNILPQSVIDWKAGKPLIEDTDIKFNPEDYDFLKMRLTTKSRKK